MHHDPMKFFDKAMKMVPVIATLAGAGGSAVGAWYAIKADIGELRREHEQLQSDFTLHCTGYNHDAWWGDDWIRHPALRGCLERWTDTRIHTAISEYQRMFVRPVLSQMKAMNPTLVLPEVVEYK